MSQPRPIKSISFTADDVRAYLAGRKTQLRVPIKPQPTCFADEAHCSDSGTWYWWQGGQEMGVIGCPYRVGDRLRVKETWAVETNGDRQWVEYRADFSSGIDCTNLVSCAEALKHGEPVNGAYWRPSSIMPPWAVRITPTITDVRVQRVQDISFTDVLAEGIEQASVVQYGSYQADTIEEVPTT